MQNISLRQLWLAAKPLAPNDWQKMQTFRAELQNAIRLEDDDAILCFDEAYRIARKQLVTAPVWHITDELCD